MGEKEKFPSTRWSRVVRASAGNSRDLEEICEQYWYPLYAFARRAGYSPEDSEDLTQVFFGRILEKDLLAQADPSQGKLRTFLLTCLDRLLTDEWRKKNAKKRGGGAVHVPIDLHAAEERYAEEPQTEQTPESCFARNWATTLLGSVMQKLQSEFEVEGKLDRFLLLQPCLAKSSNNMRYSDIAAKLGVAEGTVKNAISRLRERYRALLEAEVLDTLDDPADLHEEINALFAAYS